MATYLGNLTDAPPQGSWPYVVDLAWALEPDGPGPADAGSQFQLQPWKIPDVTEVTVVETTCLVSSEPSEEAGGWGFWRRRPFGGA